MDYTTFRAICEEASEISKYPDWYHKVDDREDVLMERWAISGSRISESETEPAGFQALEMALEELWPNIPYLKFRRICRVMVHYGTTSDSDYYSYTEYNIKYIKLTDLYDYLRSEGVI